LPTDPREARTLLGRFLMATGLVLLPLGLWFGVARNEGMTVELTMLVAGAACFLLGRALSAAPGEKG
jgi:hypothetical protein